MTYTRDRLIAHYYAALPSRPHYRYTPNARPSVRLSLPCQPLTRNVKMQVGLVSYFIAQVAYNVQT